MKYTQKKALRWMVAMGLTMTAFSWGNVEAMPTGGEVRSGDAEIKTSGQTMDIDQKTSRVALDWTGFDIAKGETVRFHQNPSDIAINRILGNKASEIYGSLLADGTVFLLNPQGILFGQGAQVDVGNLIASTAQVDDSFMKGFSAGGDVSLNLGEASKGKVINAGDIKAQGGLVALHAVNVENTGSIKNDGGKVSLSAVKNLELAIDTAGKINFETSGETANAHTLNAGTIQADGGYVVMTAKSAGDMLSEVVNNTGIIEAKTASINDKGEILLDGGDHGTVNVSGTLDASGLAEGQSGGTVRILGENTSVKDGAKLTASGDKDGGLVETSGDVLDVSTKADIEAKGRTGKAGEWLLDPLEVVIDDEKHNGSVIEPTNNATEEIEKVEDSSNSVTTHINANYISYRLSNGTSVTIQAEDSCNDPGGKNAYDVGIADIKVNAPIYKIALGSDYNTDADADRINAIKNVGNAYGNSGTPATLTLKAQRNIALNKDIIAKDGKLNVVLNADTNNDKKGMVIINGDIDTHGGDFISGCGTEPKSGNTGTYFGDLDNHEAGKRVIKTSGGSVNLYGDVAIGLNTGNLVIDTSNGSTGGNINIGRNVDSANAYHLFAYGEATANAISDAGDGKYDDLKELARVYYDNYLKDTVWLTVDELKKPENKAKYDAVAERCLNHKNVASSNVVSTIDTYFNTYVRLAEGNGHTDPKTFDEVWANKNLRTKLVKHIFVHEDQNATNRESILNNWENAVLAAKQGTAGGSDVGDKYLATVTTELENWIVGNLMSGTNKLALLGGRTQTSRIEDGKVINETQKLSGKTNFSEPRNFKWATGPEGEANGGTGTLFYTQYPKNDNKKNLDYGMFQGWSHDANHGEYKSDEPNNDKDRSGEPYVAIGSRVDGGWVDVCTNGSEVIGFIQETNNEHSSLKLNAGNGAVTIGKDVGKSAVLRDFTIETSGSVDIGGSINVVNGNVNIKSTGNIVTNGITAKVRVEPNSVLKQTNPEQAESEAQAKEAELIRESAKIKLSTQGTGHSITMKDNIETVSTAKDAVIIDAHDGKFNNESSGKEGIKTGNGGNWKVYSNSPNDDNFGTNLNSNTYALWGREAGKSMYDYQSVQEDTKEAAGRYIFNVKPVVSFTTDDRTKTYGDTADNTTTWTASAKVSEKDVLDYKEKAFNEEPVLSAANVKDDAVSQGFASTANAGVYDIIMSANATKAFSTSSKAVAHGYELKPADYQGKISVTPRDLTINNLVGTYGSAEFMPDSNALGITGLVNGDTITKVNYTLSDSYRSRTADKITAPVGTYSGAVVVDSIDFADTADKGNYNIKDNQATLTIKPKDIVLQLTGHGISLNTGNIGVVGTDYGTQLVNGDTLSTAPQIVYGIGTQLTDRTYSIDLLADGQKIANSDNGTVVGNYRFQYTGVYTLEPTSDIVELPQFAPLSFTPITGEAGYREVQEEKNSSVEQVLGLTTAKLPLVKEVNGTLTSYGTYQLAVAPDKVTMELADTSVPIPANGIHDQYREYTKNLTTKRGAADFKLSYDGSIFALNPLGQEAEKMLEAGDAAHNVDVVSQALYTAFHDMGLTLDDLDAVYVCFA